MPSMVVFNKDGTVTISQEEYDELLEDQHFLSCLRAAGVDNWDGFGDACEQFHEEKGGE